MTVIESVNEIRDALLAAERKHPNCSHLKKLHGALERGFTAHGDRLGLTEPEVQALAGGGTPKTRQP